MKSEEVFDKSWLWLTHVDSVADKADPDESLDVRRTAYRAAAIWMMNRFGISEPLIHKSKRRIGEHYISKNIFQSVDFGISVVVGMARETVVRPRMVFMSGQKLHVSREEFYINDDIRQLSPEPDVSQSDWIIPGSAIWLPSAGELKANKKQVMRFGHSIASLAAAVDFALPETMEEFRAAELELD